MKLLIATQGKITELYFNPEDHQAILARCQAAQKQWANQLVGFFINNSNNTRYAAISIKGNDGVIESMEYVDIDTNKPEFTISDEFLSNLSVKPEQAEISLREFEPILTEILTAPIKARRWEVYPAITERYQAH